MPDSAQLDMGGGGGQAKGVPGWLMVVGAIAGVAGLALLLKGSGGGGGTTAAGTSINAALGSIQEENMNLLGTTQAGFMQTQNSFASMSQQLAGGFTSTQDLINSGFTQQAAGQVQLSSQLQQTFDTLTQQIASGQQLSTAQYGQLEAIQTNPWVRQFYQNQVASTLDPQTQQYYWNAVEQVANTGHIASASIGSY